VSGEPELQRRDVPTRLPDLEPAGSEPVACEAAEGLARLRADDAVDRDVRPLLKAANRLRGFGSADPVDRALVEPMRMQADLEGGDARIGRRGAGSDGRGDKDQGQSEERPGMHWVDRFRRVQRDPLVAAPPITHEKACAGTSSQRAV